MTRDLDRAVALFHSDAGPTELRVLGTRRGTVAGYFTESAKLIAAAQATDGAAGVYVTLNPAVSEALARADNAVVPYAKHTTGDNEIAARHWALVDLDPVRLSGIPSTDAEHDQALALAPVIVAWFVEQGIPQSSLVVTDSGNGAAILVRLNLPNDSPSTELVKNLLGAVDRRFSTPAVKVDCAVFNAARITRLPGTLNRKGSGTDERPHRRARLLHVPDELVICPTAILKAIAALDPTPPPRDYPATTGSAGTPLDLPRWLTTHGLTWSREKPWHGGTLYLLEACPFDASHGANGEVHAGQYPSGAVDFVCKHNSCTDKKWHDLRALLEPEYRDRRESYERRAREQDAGAAPGGSSGDRAGDENGTHAPLRWRTARAIAESTPPEIPYRIMPFVADGAITELDGKIKLAGKTTLVSYMVAAALDGANFLGEPTVRTPVVWLTEQPDTSLRPVLERAGLLERDDLAILAYWDACHLPWPQIVEEAVRKAAEIGARMLVVDTLGQFAGLPGEAENNAGDAQQAIKPLQIAAATHRLAVVILRHEKKADADVGDAARGSTAIGGAVDVILSLRRVSGMPTTVRRLLALSRFSETPDETHIELTDHGYVIADVAGVKAAKKQAKAEGQRQQLLAALPADRDAALTAKELAEATGLSDSVVRALAKALYDEGLVDRARDDRVSQTPYRYWRCADINDDATAQATVGAEADEKAVEKGDEPSRSSQDTFSVGEQRHKLDPDTVVGPSGAPPKVSGESVSLRQDTFSSSASPDDDGASDSESF